MGVGFKSHIAVSSDHIMAEPRRKLHPNLHPTQYEYRMKDDLRLMIPTEGIMPMGSARGMPGYGLIHPNTINAAV